MHWTIDSIPNQKDRIILITGANSGLGFDSAKVLLEKGGRVILGCRSIQKAEQARERLLNKTNAGHIELLEIDLSDLKTVNKAADQITTKYKRLDLLINNAGLMAPPYTTSKQGLEIQFAVNHLSHMALSLKLLPLLAESSGRVVTVSSAAQYMGKINWNDLQGKKNYDRWASYSQSKLANVMFALELDNQLRKSQINVHSLSAHPGLARTQLQPKSVALNGSWAEGIAYKLMGPMFQSSKMGALPQLRAATDPKACSGEQYGPRFNFRGFPRLCPVAQFALKETERHKLWNISEKLMENFIDISPGQNLLTQ